AGESSLFSCILRQLLLLPFRSNRLQILALLPAGRRTARCCRRSFYRNIRLSLRVQFSAAQNRNVERIVRKPVGKIDVSYVNSYFSLILVCVIPIFPVRTYLQWYS